VKAFSVIRDDESRFALLKLILNRNRSATTMEIKPSLTADTEDAAYNCGRFLAILAATQDKAHDYKLEGPGVAERYFGTASVSPSSVFPLLIRLNRHHLNKISKSERFGGHERFIQEQIEAVLALFKPTRPGLPPTFPRTLDLQAQGRFALGFYQQHAADAAARQAYRKDQTPVLAPVTTA
jgi:CRISPR-associated protein Csd1